MTNRTLATRRPDAHPVAAGTTKIYRWGSRISLAILALGILVAIIRQEPLAESLGSPGHVFDQALHGHANGIIGLGILAMILTPLAGATLMAINFFRLPDRQFGLISSAIVLILLISIGVSLL